MSRIDSSFYEVSKYLGQYIAGQVPFLRETSCMDSTFRKALAGIEAIKALNNPELTELEQIKKVLELFGFANWARDVVTDMALRKGEMTETEVIPDDNATDGKSSP